MRHTIRVSILVTSPEDTYASSAPVTFVVDARTPSCTVARAFRERVLALAAQLLGAKPIEVSNGNGSSNGASLSHEVIP